MEPTRNRKTFKGTKITRFAPSPTGFLHLGHVVSALYVWGIAREMEAKVVVRLDDYDRDRCRPLYEKQIIEDLDFLGFLNLNETWQLRKHSDDESEVEKAFFSLKEKGLIYYCDCSRKQIKERSSRVGEEILYDSFCEAKGLAPGAGRACRLRVKEGKVSFYDEKQGSIQQDVCFQCGDFVLKDRHGSWSYHLANVVSDSVEGVNIVVRGKDILPSTGRQILLRNTLGFPEIPFYFHHKLLLEKDSKDKLSKSRKSLSIKQLRSEGFSKEEILHRASLLSGLLQEKERFSLKKISERISRDLKFLED